MLVVCPADNSHEMLRFIFTEKNKKKLAAAVMSGSKRVKMSP